MKPFVHNQMGARKLPFKNVSLVSIKDHTEYRDDHGLVIWGGQDISPCLYGEKCGKFTHVLEKEPTTQDKSEVLLAMAALDRKQPIIGVCRGAQLLCAFAGGSLIQDVSNHRKDHGVLTEDGQRFAVTSTHHQMMFPWKVPHRMIAWAEELSTTHTDGDNNEIVFPVEAYDKEGHIKEPEIVYFPAINALAIQGHPEYGNTGDLWIRYLDDLVTSFIEGQL